LEVNIFYERVFFLEKVIDVRNRYNSELNNIKYILKCLENGKYYENTGAKMDGYLATNIIKLRKQVENLLDKIEYNMKSNLEEMAEAVAKLDE